MPKNLKRPFRQIAVVGAGLLGGSIIRAVHQRKLAHSIVALCRSSRSAATVRKAKLPCRIADISDSKALRNSDLIVIATPVQSVPVIFKRIASYLSSDVCVIDVGSTKDWIQRAISKSKRGKQFVGCHPMAGTEKRGPAFADGDLYKDALCFIEKASSPASRKKAIQFWKALGSNVHIIGAKEHDRIVARVSHLPHMAAELLYETVMTSDKQGDSRFVGKGFGSMVRTAGSNPEMWADILATNSVSIDKELGRMIASMTSFKKLLKPARHAALLRRLQNIHAIKARRS